MLSLTAVLTIIFIHFFADFIMQDEKWATTKSKSFTSLLFHTLTYSLIWEAVIVIGVLSFDLSHRMLYFPLITFIAHTITDYFTSKVTSKMFAAGKYGSPIPNLGAFSVIGFDQVLHYIQLFSTYYLLR